MNSTHELTVLERIDQLMGYARNQRNEYLMKYGHDTKYHLGYIAALKVIRQHITTKPVEQSPHSSSLDRVTTRPSSQRTISNERKRERDFT